MKIDLLKDEAKRLGLRVTKKIRGKRVPLSEKELKMKIQRRRPPALEIQVRDSKKNLYERVKHFYERLNQMFHVFVEFLHQFQLNAFHQFHPHHQFHLNVHLQRHQHHQFQLKEILAQI